MYDTLVNQIQIMPSYRKWLNSNASMLYLCVPSVNEGPSQTVLLYKNGNKIETFLFEPDSKKTNEFKVLLNAETGKVYSGVNLATGKPVAIKLINYSKSDPAKDSLDNLRSNWDSWRVAKDYLSGHAGFLDVIAADLAYIETVPKTDPLFPSFTSLAATLNMNITKGTRQYIPAMFIVTEVVMPVRLLPSTRDHTLEECHQHMKEIFDAMLHMYYAGISGFNYSINYDLYHHINYNKTQGKFIFSGFDNLKIALQPANAIFLDCLRLPIQHSAFFLLRRNAVNRNINSFVNTFCSKMFGVLEDFGDLLESKQKLFNEGHFDIETLKAQIYADINDFIGKMALIQILAVLFTDDKFSTFNKVYQEDLPELFAEALLKFEITSSNQKLLEELANLLDGNPPENYNVRLFKEKIQAHRQESVAPGPVNVSPAPA